MRGFRVGGLVHLLLSGVAAAQVATEGLAAAQERIVARQWAAALQGLLELQEKAATEPEQELVAGKLMEVGEGLAEALAFPEALRAREAALVIRQRLHGNGDHEDVATSHGALAASHRALGQPGRALPHDQAALAMRQRLHAGRDHKDVALSQNNLAVCFANLGQQELALPEFEAALAMRRRLSRGRDDPDVAISLNNVARCRSSLGQQGKALPQFEEAIAMHKRLRGDGDHPDVAMCLGNYAACLRSLSQADKALPLFEAALAMQQRLHGDGNHPSVATSLNSLATCFAALGQPDKALPQFQAALEIRQQIYAGRDHRAVAESLSNVATCLDHLGRSLEALPLHEGALAIERRRHGNRDDEDVARNLGNFAICLHSLDRADEALPHYEAALAMNQRLHADRDHPAVAASLKSAARCLASLGQTEKALSWFQDSLAIRKRLYGDHDHWDVARSLSDIAECLLQLGQTDKALEPCERACSMIERLRERSETSAELRLSLFDKLKSTNAFERLQILTHATDPCEALRAAERSRARELLDMLEQQRSDPLEEALVRARLRGDVAAAERIQSLRGELEMATFEGDRLLRQLTRLDDARVADAEREARRNNLTAESDRTAQRRRQLFDERARLVAGALPVGRVRTASEIQTALQQDELLLEFTITRAASFLYVVSREHGVQAVPLPTAAATVERTLPLLLRRSSRAQLDDNRGRDPDAGRNPGADASDPSRELFASLIPKDLWPRLRSARRVFLAAHRSLHRLPFELLVTAQKDGKPVHWLDDGPEIAYVQSGSALCWQRERASEVGGDSTSLDLLAVCDPRTLEADSRVPELGAFVLAVDDCSEGARIGLQPGDVLVAYDGKPLVDDTMLHDQCMQTEVAIVDGKRSKEPIPIEIWRQGETRKLEANQGRLGIRVGKGKARQACAGALRGDAEIAQFGRQGDLERLGRLPPLRGARQEGEEITALFVAKGRRVECLLDKDATEPAVFESAAKARYLHFACHGIAEEYAGQSLSMLVLSQPQHVLLEDDGLLELDDLQRWRGRLASCRLVVLSACRTNVGPLYRDEAPQALPLGFLFAGAAAVVSSLWAVDDASTRELMTDFYRRLLDGEKDRLHAFTAARKALRAKYPEPFHWAPFLYVGSPD